VKTTSRKGANVCNAGEEVVFVYYEGGHDPCHAVVKRTDGPWSANRVGFCGYEPSYGPMPYCIEPDGGLCHICAKHVEKRGGKWVVKKHVGAQPFGRSRRQACDDSSWADDD